MSKEIKLFLLAETSIKKEATTGNILDNQQTPVVCLSDDKIAFTNKKFFSLMNDIR